MSIMPSSANWIFSKFELLNDFQKEMILKILNEIDELQLPPNLEKLEFTVDLNKDNEFLFYRKSLNGLVNIIVNPDDCIAFSYIPIIGERTLHFMSPDQNFKP